MRICIVAEGCYPYVVGGVSSWIHSMIKIFPEYQFVVLAIVANRSLRGKFVYDLPENVVEVHELYLEDADWRPKELKRAARLKLNEREYAALRSLLMNQNVDWDTLFSFFGEKEFSLNELLMGEDFFRAVQECYTVRYAGAVFSDFLWTMRSMYLPLFLTLGMRLPRADVYHCVATGYAGVLGSMAAGCVLTLVYSLLSKTYNVLSIHVLARHYMVLLGMGAVASVLGILGDLFASAVKRQAGIKDYGTIFPGHGGILDRFDSVMFIAPFVSIAVRYFFYLL